MPLVCLQLSGTQPAFRSAESLLVTTLLPYPDQTCSALSSTRHGQLNRSLPAAAGKFTKIGPAYKRPCSCARSPLGRGQAFVGKASETSASESGCFAALIRRAGSVSSLSNRCVLVAAVPPPGGALRHFDQRNVVTLPKTSGTQWVQHRCQMVFPTI